ncbi:SGNH/GDSL hydrolase family protein [Pseudaestuariivita atlantica]|uniref:Lipolytic enzyme, G-D-S-L n=1 Tax=Pseudaestuariivita atlantica TaxID=1317121 RepID=A0A0L1JP14_9RHOB|nr:SGNH/GDSL hydrolase family protein [Pseudaestuariivita atlantica]KNG93499.1 lipolytic enzyme, G-D-S-L [Pseudaestuariivita atlantica]
MRTILTFGDSNTHGSRPTPPDGRSVGRYGPSKRWPTVMAADLAGDWHLVEEGLPGRTTQYEDPGMPANMDGHAGLLMALKSHAPVDVLTIMLGTNDLKTRFAATPMTIAGGIAGMLDLAQSPEMAEAHPALRILLICPPPIREIGVFANQFIGGEGTSLQLRDMLATLANARDVAYLDAGSVIRVSDVDGIHFDPDAHRALGRAVAAKVSTLV